MQVFRKIPCLALRIFAVKKHHQINSSAYKNMNMDTLVIGRSKVGGNLKLKGGAGTSYDTTLERYAVILQRYIRYFFSFESTLL